MRPGPAPRSIEELQSPSRIAAKLSERTTIDPVTHCHEWVGHRNAKGYGTLHIGYQRMYAHRAAFAVAHGQIPSGMFVCHRCDNPACCNPDHLFLGSNLDNVRDMQAKGRKPAPSRAAVLAIVGANGAARPSDVAAETGLTLSAARSAMYRLRNSKAAA